MYGRQRKLKMVAWLTPKQMSAGRRARRLQFHSLGQLSRSDAACMPGKQQKHLVQFCPCAPKTHQREKTWNSTHGISRATVQSCMSYNWCNTPMPSWQRHFIFWSRRIKATSWLTRPTYVQENAWYFIEHKFLCNPLKCVPTLVTWSDKRCTHKQFKRYPSEL